MATREGERWTDEELDLIVADYFLMLNDEAAGVSFNKAQHNRLLRSEIDRTKGSIESKHKNISAFLRQLGLPELEGICPRRIIKKRLLPQSIVTSRRIQLH